MAKQKKATKDIPGIDDFEPPVPAAPAVVRDDNSLGHVGPNYNIQLARFAARAAPVIHSMCLRAGLKDYRDVREVFLAVFRDSGGFPNVPGLTALTESKIIELKRKQQDIEALHRTVSSLHLEELAHLDLESDWFTSNEEFENLVEPDESSDDDEAVVEQTNDQLLLRLDDLQKTVSRQNEIINERARANDLAIAALSAKDQGRMLTYEVLQGVVADVSDTEVVIRFDTGDDVVEQTYNVEQFKLGKVPTVGDHVAAYVHLALTPSPSANPVDESKGPTHEPRARRNVERGDHRF